jgi:hypothetical protein
MKSPKQTASQSRKDQYARSPEGRRRISKPAELAPFVALLLLSTPPCSGQTGTAVADPRVPEPWVRHCRITTLNVMERDAAAVARGTEVARHDKWLWSPLVDGKEGVLIVHPPARGVPAVLAMDLNRDRYPADHVLRITIRGSRHEPGVILKVLAGGKVLREIGTGNRWSDVELPLSELPRGEGEVRFEMHPTGWMFEYAYIDAISVGVTLGNRAAEKRGGSPDPAITGADSDREWTQEATGKSIRGVLLRKSGDNSQITIKSPDGREIDIKTEILTRADRDFIAGWAAPKAEPGGIVRGRIGGALSQAQGGKSRVMEDLQSVLTPYGKPVEDTGPNPGAFVYKGQAWYGGGPRIEIPYLMPRAKALALLVKRAGPASPRPAVAPGFPPGMQVYEYDIQFDVYNRMFVIVDQADQVVALQAKAETRNDPMIPGPEWKAALMPKNSTTDFVEPRTGGAAAHVLDLRNRDKRIIIDLETARMETLLFLPEPMINLCLFHIEQDLRKR